MTDPIDLLSLVLSGVMISLTLLGLIISAIMPEIDLLSRKFFMSLFAINILLIGVALVELFDWEVSIEQVQFEDSLLVDYDISHKKFRVPPLTLQPIVENAVKHGMDPEYAPLQITIKTRETNSGSEIIVADNGLGFSPADDADKPHTALANIR